MGTKSTKFYSLDECLDKDKIFTKLDILSDDIKIEYVIVETDLIKIKYISLNTKEIKELNHFFHNNDVIEDKDYEEEEEEEDDEDDYDEF